MMFAFLLVLASVMLESLSFPVSSCVISSFVDLTPAYLTVPQAFRATAGIERINRCAEPLYYFSVWQGHDASPSDHSRMLCAGQTHFEPYYLANDKGGGISEKYASEPFGPLTAGVAVFQFEYTVEAPSSKIYTDLSTIDCGAAGERGQLDDCPARKGGYVLRFSNPSCNVTLCVGSTDPSKPCDEAYSRPTDDDKGMRSCEYGGNEFYNVHNTTLIFCPNDEDVRAVREQRQGLAA